MDWETWSSRGYWIVFIAAFLVVASWESARPYRTWTSSPARRWRNHGLLMACSTVFQALLLRTGPVALAILLQQRGRTEFLGQPPYWATFPLTFLLLDGAAFALHWLQHHIPWLWRLHHVHHSDLEYDVSTAIRAHPIEALCQSLTSLAAVYLFAPPPEAVVLAELITVANSLYVHANAELPAPWQQRLQGWIMTPDLHRIHHSQVRVDNDSNIGVVLMMWDRMCGSFRTEPEEGRNNLRIGLPDVDPQHFLDVGAILTEPFRSPRRDGATAGRNP